MNSGYSDRKYNNNKNNSKYIELSYLPSDNECDYNDIITNNLTLCHHINPFFRHEFKTFVNEYSNKQFNSNL